jgi:hypothetical protein
VDYSCRVIAAQQVRRDDQWSSTGANPVWHVYENNSSMKLEADTIHTRMYTYRPVKASDKE